MPLKPSADRPSRRDPSELADAEQLVASLQVQLGASEAGREMLLQRDGVRESQTNNAHRELLLVQQHIRAHQKICSDGSRTAEDRVAQLQRLEQLDGTLSVVLWCLEQQLNERLHDLHVPKPQQTAALAEAVIEGDRAAGNPVVHQVATTSNPAAEDSTRREQDAATDSAIDLADYSDLANHSPDTRTRLLIKRLAESDLARQELQQECEQLHVKHAATIACKDAEMTFLSQKLQVCQEDASAAQANTHKRLAAHREAIGGYQVKGGHLENQLRSMQQRVGALQTKLATSETEKQKVVDRDTDAEISNAQDTVNALRVLLAKKRVRLEEVEGENTTLIQSRGVLIAQLGDAQLAATAVKQQLSVSEQQLAGLNADLADAHETVADLKEQLAAEKQAAHRHSA